MEYQGKLYGHIGNKKYFDTGKTADDWDNLEKRIAELETKNKVLIDREKEIKEALFKLIEMSSTWGKEWFKKEDWDNLEKSKRLI